MSRASFTGDYHVPIKAAEMAEALGDKAAELGMAEHEFAKSIGLSSTAISGLRSGRNKHMFSANVKKVEKALGVSAGTFTKRHRRSKHLNGTTSVDALVLTYEYFTTLRKASANEQARAQKLLKFLFEYE